MSFGPAVLTFFLRLALVVLEQAAPPDETAEGICQQGEEHICPGHCLPKCVNANWVCQPCGDAGAD